MEIGQKNKVFNLPEARELLPLVRAITASHQECLQPVQARLDKMLSNDPRRSKVEDEFEYLVSRWKGKIEQLGGLVSNLWVVDFDVGDGSLCWKFPEIGLLYFRPKNADFSSRQRIKKYIEENQPEWARLG